MPSCWRIPTSPNSGNAGAGSAAEAPVAHHGANPLTPLSYRPFPRRETPESMSSPRFLILADGEFSPMTSKTANSVIRYRPEQVVGVVDRVHAGKTVQQVLGFGGTIPVLGSMEEGLRRKPTAVLIGIAPAGGKLPDEWRSWLADALDAGCDLWSGLHTFLDDDPLRHERAKASGRKIFDVRRPPHPLPVAAGLARNVEPLVVLTVGTDCNVGKMTGQLQLVRGLNERG